MSSPTPCNWRPSISRGALYCRGGNFKQGPYGAFENGPDDFGINPKAEVTVTLYRGLKVKANHAFGPGQLMSKKASDVLADVPKLLE